MNKKFALLLTITFIFQLTAMEEEKPSLHGRPYRSGWVPGECLLEPDQVKANPQ